jgi:hypothetical protein
MKPSLFKIGEGCQDWSIRFVAMSGNHNDGLSSHPHGGVSGHGMFDEMLMLRGEICGGGRYSLTVGTSASTARPVQAVTEVGVVHTSREATNRCRAKGPHLVEVRSETKGR